MGNNILRKALARPPGGAAPWSASQSVLAAPQRARSSCVWASGRGRGSGGSRRHSGPGHGQPPHPFGQLARGPGTIAGLPRVHDDHGRLPRPGHSSPRAPGPQWLRHTQGGVAVCTSPRASPCMASWLATARRSPEGRRATSTWALATSIPTKQGVRLRTPVRPTFYGLTGTRQRYGLWESSERDDPATLRSRRTKATSVSHVPGLRDGDAPTSPLKIQGWRQSAARPC